MGPSDSPSDLSETLWVCFRKEREGEKKRKGWRGRWQDTAAEPCLSAHMMNESVSHQSDAEQL